MTGKFTVHVGLPKTGTSSLQAMLGQVRDLDLVHVRQGDLRQNICLGLQAFVHGPGGSPTAPVQIAGCARALADIAAACAQRGIPLVLSDENLSMQPLELWHRLGQPPSRVCSRLHDFLRDGVGITGDVQILIGTREPAAWLASRFGRFGCTNWHMRNRTEAARQDQQRFFEEFLDDLANGAELARSLAWLDPQSVVATFGAVFGRENVKTYRLEDYAADPPGVLGDLERFLGCTGLLALHARLGPKNVARTGQNTWSFRDFDYHLPDALRDRVNARFAALPGPHRA